MALTARQEAFIAAYIGPARFVGVRAAKLAGYRGNDKTLSVTVADLLGNPRIAEAIAEARAAIKAEGIACLEARITSQNARWRDLQAVVAARAEAYDGAAPGASTGLLARTYKQVGMGQAARLVEEWTVDTGLLAELRQLEQHTAKELGQWTERNELTGKGGAPLLIRVEYADPDPDAAPAPSGPARHPGAGEPV
jgi:phage terminase small subunit